MKITAELLDKYGKGLCTQEERNAVETWMEVQSGFETIGDQIPEGIENTELEIVQERLWNRINETRKDFPRNSGKSYLRLNRIMLAASVAILVGLSALFFVNSKDIYRSGFGETKTIKLRDGTRIILNSGSELTVPNNFWNNPRSVTLNGEAYFEVTENPELPFTVTTDISVTKVLGTKFNLTAYENESNIIHLDQGRVEFKSLLGHSNQASVLLPGEQATIVEGIVEKESTIGIDHIAWMEKKLVFTEKPFESVAKTLERHYGVAFEIKKQGLATRKYNGSHKNQPLKQLMEDVAFVMKFKYVIEGNTIVVY